MVNSWARDHCDRLSETPTGTKGLGASIPVGRTTPRGQQRCQDYTGLGTKTSLRVESVALLAHAQQQGLNWQDSHCCALSALMDPEQQI